MIWLKALLSGLTWALYPFIWEECGPSPARRYYSLPTLSWCLSGIGSLPGCYTRWDTDADLDVDLRDVANVLASPMTQYQGAND